MEAFAQLNFPGTALHLRWRQAPEQTDFSSQLKRHLSLDRHWTSHCGKAWVELGGSSLPFLQVGTGPEFGQNDTKILIIHFCIDMARFPGVQRRWAGPATLRMTPQAGTGLVTRPPHSVSGSPT